MAMPGVSNFSPLDHEKLKVDKDLVAEEQHNTDSQVDLGGDKRYHKITLREGFKLWRNMFGMAYSSPEEGDYRFSVFRETLARSEDVPALSLMQTINCPGLTDRTLTELELSRRGMHNTNLCCYLPLSELQAWADEIQTEWGGVDPFEEYTREIREYTVGLAELSNLHWKTLKQ